MWHAALRDLVWRRKRYAISAFGAAVVFAVGLAVTGVSDAFPAELDRTFETLRASSFIVPDGVSGPITGAQPFDPFVLPPDVDPMAYLVQTANPEEPRMVAVFGLTPGEAEPTVARGSQLGGLDQAIVDSGAGAAFDVGATVEVSGRSFDIVGQVDHLSVNAGMPIVVIPLETFQATLLGGLPMATAGISRDTSIEAPPGFHVVSAEAAREDTLRILGNATSTIELVKVLLWVVAALIVGSVMYLSVVERTRDFAVFKAIGTATGPMAAGVAIQAVVLSVTAALMGEILAFLIAPLFPLEVLLSRSALLGLPAVALLVGILSGAFALRRAVSVEPALAFGGAG